MEDFLNLLKEKALFFKLESDPKFGGAVSVDDVIDVMKCLVASYDSYIDVEYSKILKEIDRKKIKKLKDGLKDENKLVFVDLKFESFGAAVSPNTITSSLPSLPQISELKKWKKDAFEDYKENVFEANYNDAKFLKKISQRYTEEERQKIYKPVIDGIAKRKNTKALFSTKNSIPKPLSKPKPRSYSILVPNIQKTLSEIEKVETRTSLALVEIKGNQKKPKVLELFEEIKNPVFQLNKIVVTDRSYNLIFPVNAELVHEAGAYILENHSLGIYGMGKTQEEAQASFNEEFDYIYRRYNELPDEKLTEDVIQIKTYLNTIVKDYVTT